MGAQVGKPAILGGDGAGVVQLAVPDHPSAGAEALGLAVRQLRELHALGKRLALAHHVHLRAVRQAGGNTALGRALRRPSRSGKPAVFLRRTGGLSDVEPPPTALGQIIRPQLIGVGILFPAAGHQQQNDRNQKRGELFHGRILPFSQ